MHRAHEWCGPNMRSRKRGRITQKSNANANGRPQTKRTGDRDLHAVATRHSPLDAHPRHHRAPQPTHSPHHNRARFDFTYPTHSHGPKSQAKRLPTSPCTRIEHVKLCVGVRTANIDTGDARLGTHNEAARIPWFNHRWEIILYTQTHTNTYSEGDKNMSRPSQTTPVTEASHTHRLQGWYVP